MLECPVPVEPVVVSSFCTRIALRSNWIASWTYVDVGGRLVASFPCVCMRVWPGGRMPSLGRGRDSCTIYSTYECNVAGAAGQPATCSLVPRLGYMYNARRNPRSLQYYSRVDVPSTDTGRPGILGKVGSWLEGGSSAPNEPPLVMALLLSRRWPPLFERSIDFRW